MKLKNKTQVERESKYFDDITVGETLYSLVYGKGKVSTVLENAGCETMDGFYAFQVKFENGNVVYYTLEGYPNWCSKNASTQTVFYPSDIDFEDIDFEPIEKIPKEKKIKKLQDEHNLEMRCPSGAWRNASDCPASLVTKMIDAAKYHLFRKGKN